MKIKFSKRYIPVKIYKVMSRREPGLYHSVVLYADGSIDCNCVAGSYNRMCSHQIKVRKHIQKDEPKLWQKIKKTTKEKKKKR